MQTKKTIFPSNLHAHTFYCDGKNNAEDYILNLEHVVKIGEVIFSLLKN